MLLFQFFIYASQFSHETTVSNLRMFLSSVDLIARECSVLLEEKYTIETFLRKSFEEREQLMRENIALEEKLRFFSLVEKQMLTVRLAEQRDTFRRASQKLLEEERMRYQQALYIKWNEHFNLIAQQFLETEPICWD